ncbi:MAG: hypothetical protein IBJ13_11520 [Sphingopyxis sp.]|nr:hypothetical protein [Sphingopyxis sp.]
MLGLLLFAASGSAYGLGPEWQPVADPLAEARAGKIYCDLPDHAAKTCEGAVMYRFDQDGEAISVMMLPISNEPDLTIAMPTGVRVEDGALCSRPEQSDIDRMRLMMGRQPYDKPPGQKLLAIFKEEMAPLLVGKRVCERIFANGDRRFSVGIVDGVHRPDQDGEIAWLDADADYDLRAIENPFGE